MKIELAGYNVDAKLLKSRSVCSSLTPETISAAYARISRSDKSVGELREEAVLEVEKARASNEKIIFDMGHASVAEHAVFNFDITGISRLAIEWLERFRLCSYTEKSQRYVKLDHDFIIPKEIKGTPIEKELHKLISEQVKCYLQLVDGNIPKEDARYATVLATTGQLGMTVNARNLELIIRRSAESPLFEVRDLGQQLHAEVLPIAPSLIRYTEPTQPEKRRRFKMLKLISSIGTVESDDQFYPNTVKKIHRTGNADCQVAAALVHEVTNHPFIACLRWAENLNRTQIGGIFHEALKSLGPYDAVPRVFEHVYLTFEVTLSASAYAQLKRHRMTTQTVQDYNQALGVTVPPSVKEAGLEDAFMEQIKKSESAYEQIHRRHPYAALYALTNAHRRRVLLTMNLRELYHFIRLREDHHAQWEIRRIAEKMHEKAKLEMPHGTMLLCGKGKVDYETRSKEADNGTS